MDPINLHNWRAAKLLSIKDGPARPNKRERSENCAEVRGQAGCRTLEAGTEASAP
jgi:hypothetical protein